MLKVKLLLVATTVLMAANGFAASDAVIGYVKTVSGDAVVSAGGKAQVARPGTPIQIADLLKTGKRSSMGVTFKDNTMLSLGPDTELTVDEYLYAPGKGDLKLGVRINKGTLNYVSGVIAKLKPEAVILHTPTGNIGVRGTHFAMKVVEK